MIRLFVAIELPSVVRSSLLMLQGGVPGARWQREDQFHLTLRFIGEVDEGVAHDVDDALAVLRAPRFDLALSGVGQFGGRTPRALWAGITPAEPVLHLQRKVETALQRVNLPPEERKFSPHVTLARLKSAPPVKVMEFLSRHGLFASASFTVDRFTLFSSHLSASGSVYRAERAYPLH